MTLRTLHDVCAAFGSICAGHQRKWLVSLSVHHVAQSVRGAAKLQSSTPSVAVLKESELSYVQRCLCPAEAPCTLGSRIDLSGSLFMHDVTQGINATTTLQSSNPCAQAFKVSEANQSCDFQNKIGAVAQEPFFPCPSAPRRVRPDASIDNGSSRLLSFYPYLTLCGAFAHIWDLELRVCQCLYQRQQLHQVSLEAWKLQPSCTNPLRV